jgi:hypothetical protein
VWAAFAAWNVALFAGVVRLELVAAGVDTVRVAEAVAWVTLCWGYVLVAVGVGKVVRRAARVVGAGK